MLESTASTLCKQRLIAFDYKFQVRVRSGLLAAIPARHGTSVLKQEPWLSYACCMCHPLLALRTSAGWPSCTASETDQAASSMATCCKNPCPELALHPAPFVSVMMAVAAAASPDRHAFKGASSRSRCVYYHPGGELPQLRCRKSKHQATVSGEPCEGGHCYLQRLHSLSHRLRAQSA